jgi:hypothetical protein
MPLHWDITGKIPILSLFFLKKSVASLTQVMPQNSVFYRQFSSSSAALAKKKETLSKIRVPSKKMMAIKAQRRALKAQKKKFNDEKMPLEDAIAILRVRTVIFAR